MKKKMLMQNSKKRYIIKKLYAFFLELEALFFHLIKIMLYRKNLIMLLSFFNKTFSKT